MLRWFGLLSVPTAAISSFAFCFVLFLCFETVGHFRQFKTRTIPFTRRAKSAWQIWACAMSGSVEMNSHCVKCNQPEIDSSSKYCDNLALANADVIYELLISLKCGARSDKSITVSFQIDLDSCVVWISSIHLEWGCDFSLNLNALKTNCVTFEPVTLSIVIFETDRSYNSIFFVYGNVLVAKRAALKPHAHNNLWRVANIRSYIYMFCVGVSVCVFPIPIVWTDTLVGQKARAGHIQIHCLTRNTEDIKYIRNGFTSPK